MTTVFAAVARAHMCNDDIYVMLLLSYFFFDSRQISLARVFL